MGLTCKSKAKTLKSGEKARFSKNYFFYRFPQNTPGKAVGTPLMWSATQCTPPKRNAHATSKLQRARAHARKLDRERKLTLSANYVTRLLFHYYNKLGSHNQSSDARWRITCIPH